jgi:hypothetical protein
VKPAASKKPAKPAKAAKAEAALDGFDELSVLAGKAKAMEDEERAKSGGSNAFIALVQGNSGILLEDDPRYIEGVALHDYVIPSKRLCLGAKLDATVIGCFKLYEERAKKERDSDIAPTVGFWHPEDAEAVPVAPGEIFQRDLPNGNILMPVHWVFLYLHKYPDITGGLLAFRSTGNKVYKDLEKILKAESELCTQIRFTIGKQPIRNEKYNKTNYFPDFVILRRNFDYLDGRVIPVEGGLSREELKTVLERSHEVQEQYRNYQLVAKKRNIPALAGASLAVPALAAGGQYERDNEGEETTTF